MSAQTSPLFFSIIRPCGEGVGNRAWPISLLYGQGVGGVPDFVRAASLILPFQSPTAASDSQDASDHTLLADWLSSAF